MQNMKKNICLVITILAFICSSIVIGQTNLVPNASFEDLSDCPTDASQLELAKNWFSPNLGTPDLYNTCASAASVGVPLNSSYSSFRFPKIGEGYIGIFTYETPSYKEEKREYVTIALKKQLLVKQKYYLFFYCVPKYLIKHNSECFSDAIGMAATQNKIMETIPFKRLDLKPIAFNKGKILDDTTGWTKISSVYHGNGEQYICIGSFEPNATTLNTKESCEAGFFGHSYYFIDDVGVYEYDPLPDTLQLCKGQSKRVGGRFLDATYQWNTGATDSTITVSKAGRYIMTATMDGKYELSDTLYVLNPEAVVATFVTDTSFCKGESVSVLLPDIGAFQWSNTSKNNVFSTKSAGNYQLTVTTDCGIYQHKINVTEEDCSCNIFIPNAFSPNGDQINDELNCYVKCGIDFNVSRFQVFDRWGNQVYFLTDTKSSAIAWDGTFRGELLEQGIYTYTLEYEYVKKGQLVKEKKFGEFILMK
jgi:gliding motility-associated-like protein